MKVREAGDGLRLEVGLFGGHVGACTPLVEKKAIAGGVYYADRAVGGFGTSANHDSVDAHTLKNG